jgi:hypothetical protein
LASLFENAVSPEIAMLDLEDWRQMLANAPMLLLFIMSGEV